MPASQMAMVGIFVLLLGAALYFCRPLLLPILAALVIAMTFAPLVKLAAQHGVSPWVTATLLVLALVAAAGLAVTLLAAPVAEWIARAPEIGATHQAEALRAGSAVGRLARAAEDAAAVGRQHRAVEPSQISLRHAGRHLVTPAVAQIALFCATLFFFARRARWNFASYVASLFASRDAKLRFIRIANDIEHNLASYVAIVTAINVGLGVVVAVGAWLFGFPEPVDASGSWPWCSTTSRISARPAWSLILFGVGLVTFPSLGYALLPPAAFVALTTIEGHIITPTVLGPPAHAQSARGLAGARVLGLAVGADRRVSRGSAHDRRPGHDQSPLPGR